MQVSRINYCTGIIECLPAQKFEVEPSAKLRSLGFTSPLPQYDNMRLAMAFWTTLEIGLSLVDRRYSL